MFVSKKLQIFRRQELWKLSAADKLNAHKTDVYVNNVSKI